MKKIVYIFFGALIAIILFMAMTTTNAVTKVGSASPLTGSQGGTGYATTTAGNIGNCVTVLGNSPISYTFATCGTGGGSGSTSKWATTTDLTVLSPNGGSTIGIIVAASSTINRLSTDFATTTNATSTNFSTNVLSVTGFGTTTFSGGVRTSGLESPYARFGYITATSTATSTFSGGISLSSGCFSYPGTIGCILSATSSGFAATSTYAGSVGSGVAGQHGVYFASNQALVATSSVFTATNQNTGIGTSTPYAQLSVQRMTLPGFSSGVSQALFAIASSSPSGSTSPILVVNSNGFVGINVPVPAVSFDVSGNIWTTNAGSARNSQYDLGAFRIGAGGSIYSYGAICTSNNSADCSGTGGTVLGNSNTTAVNNIPNSGAIFFNNGSNLGIGTSTPGGLLSLAGNPPYPNERNTNATTSQLILSGVNLTFASSSTTTIPNIVNSWRIATSSGGANPLPILSIDGLNGRLGIATTAPGTSLAINGALSVNASSTIFGLAVKSSLRLEGTLACNTGNALATNASGDVICDTDDQGAGGGGSPNSKWGTSTDNTSIYTALATRVGISTTSPMAKLSIQLNTGETTNPYSFIIASSTATATTTLFAIDNNGSVGVNDLNGDFRFEAAGTLLNGYFGLSNVGDGDIMIVDPNGKVGIATTSPWGSLSIVNSCGLTPCFVIATTTTSAIPLLAVFGTTTDELSYNLNSNPGVRASIGSNEVLLDQLTVKGRINTSEWMSQECSPVFLTATVSADTSRFCGMFSYQEDTTGRLIAPGLTSGSDVYATLTSDSVNDGSAVYLGISTATNGSNWATSTPILDVIGRIASPKNSTSSSLYIGFIVKDTTGSTFEVPPNNGCWFEASSTRPNWMATCQNSIGNDTLVDTKIASTSNYSGTGSDSGDFYRFRIETSSTRVIFYMGTATSTLKQVANITISSTGNALFGIPMIMEAHTGAFAGSATLGTGIDFRGVKVWIRSFFMK